jgi:hypothetical protein
MVEDANVNMKDVQNMSPHQDFAVHMVVEDDVKCKDV